MNWSIHLKISLILLIWLSTAQGEEWFMPDSHLINAQQFSQYVENDKSAFKIVKFFTPHCMYCRYLKVVIDKLKHEKEWCFKLYDFNCQWYPQFCMNNVRAASFPYTVIYNQEGVLDQEIVGFYPEPVLRQIFQRIQTKCMAAKNINQKQIEIIANDQTQSLSQSDQVHQQNNQKEVKQNNNVNEIQQNSGQIPKQQEKPVQAQQTQTIQNRIQAIREMQQQKQATVEVDGNVQQIKEEQKIAQEVKQQQSKQATVTQHTTDMSVYNYLFYGTCLVLGGYYVYHVHNTKQANHASHSDHPLPTSPPQTSNEATQNKTYNSEQKPNHPKQQESELLASLPDDQL